MALRGFSWKSNPGVYQTFYFDRLTLFIFPAVSSCWSSVYLFQPSDIFFSPGLSEILPHTCTFRDQSRIRGSLFTDFFFFLGYLLLGFCPIPFSAALAISVLILLFLRPIILRFSAWALSHWLESNLMGKTVFVFMYEFLCGSFLSRVESFDFSLVLSNFYIYQPEVGARVGVEF